MGRQAPPAAASAAALAIPAIASVRIERRGGLAGLKACADPHPAGLTTEQLAALGGLLADCPPQGTAAPRPDRFHYRIRVGLADGDERLLDLPEEAMPEALAALVRPVLG